jgi:hypothetical protein
VGRLPCREVSLNSVNDLTRESVWISDEGVGGEAAERTPFSTQGRGARVWGLGSRPKSEIRNPTSEIREGVGGERDQLRMRATGAVEKAAEGLACSLAEHGERSGEILQPVVTDRERCPTAAHEAAVNVGIPEDAVAVLEQPFVGRAQLGPGESGLIGEGGIQHVRDMEKLMAQKNQQALRVQQPLRVKPDPDRSPLRLPRPLPAGGNEEVRALIPPGAGTHDDAGAGVLRDQRLLMKRLPDRRTNIQAFEPASMELPEGGLAFLRIRDLVKSVALASEAWHLADLDGPEDGFLDEARLVLH